MSKRRLKAVQEILKSTTQEMSNNNTPPRRKLPEVLQQVEGLLESLHSSRRVCNKDKCDTRA
jgi:hypothetical protein